MTKKLSTYLEFATDSSTVAHSSWVGTIDTALVYQPVDEPLSCTPIPEDAIRTTRI